MRGRCRDAASFFIGKRVGNCKEMFLDIPDESYYACRRKTGNREEACGWKDGNDG